MVQRNQAAGKALPALLPASSCLATPDFAGDVAQKPGNHRKPCRVAWSGQIGKARSTGNGGVARRNNGG
jgi:hypothetical protein